MGEQNMQNQARALIQQASQNPEAMEKLKQIMALAAAIQQEMQAMQQSSQQSNQQKVKAALGAKLDYLNKLKGICPEGTEKVYLEKGGCMCKKLKAAEGAELKEEQPKNEIQKFNAAKGCKTKKKK